MLKDKIYDAKKEVLAFEASDIQQAEDFRLKFLVSKGLIKALFNEFKSAPAEEKRMLGKELNELKKLAEEKYASVKKKLESNSQQEDENNRLDLTLAGEGVELGSRHPLSSVRKEIVEIFNKLGFVVSEGPDVEDDWHNFSALNFAPEH